jgi:RNA polymerase sigma-70 factor, ECF subfamily
LAIPDEELVSQARSGSVTAFDELVSRHQERVFALAYRMLGDAEDAADVQQETFLRAWTSLGRFRGDAAFTTWLHRITVNSCLSRRRRSNPRTSAESLDECRAYTYSGSGVTCQERVLNRVMIREVLASIPANQRTLLVLKEVEERSIEEIAQITGSSVSTVRKQLWRARKLFRKRLREYVSEDEK